MPQNDLHNEWELLVLVSRDNQEAFARIVDIYWKKVYGFAMAYSKSRILAEETTQDVFMDIWKSRDRLPQLENFGNYLFIITRNRVFKVLRSTLAATIEIAEEHGLEELWLPHQQLEVRELNSLIHESIELLPPMRKKVFLLSRIEGKSYKEIAAKLNLSTNTVKEHIVKALQSIRQYLNDRNARNTDVVLVCLFTSLLAQ